jgi:hypothetical protein
MHLSNTIYVKISSYNMVGDRLLKIFTHNLSRSVRNAAQYQAFKSHVRSHDPEFSKKYLRKREKKSVIPFENEMYSTLHPRNPTEKFRRPRVKRKDRERDSVRRKGGGGWRKSK